MTMLGGTAAGLALGSVLWFAGATTGSDVVWAVTGVAGAFYALLAMIDTLRHRRLGVDAIAVLAVTGALVVGEFLAAAVIAVMVASGRATRDVGRGAGATRPPRAPRAGAEGRSPL